MTAVARAGARAERTRTLILRTAEAVFAEKGYAAARLEDVAERVGIRRASIVYYFRDKRALYDAVLAGLFGELLARSEEKSIGTAPPAERVESAVTTWVDYVAERPAFGRILLREIADASPAEKSAVVQHAMPVIDAMAMVVREGQQKGLFAPIDPIHLASTIAGATVFFFCATPLLGSEWPFNPTSPAEIATYRAEVLRITRRLLGSKGPRSLRSGKSADRSRSGVV